MARWITQKRKTMAKRRGFKNVDWPSNPDIIPNMKKQISKEEQARLDDIVLNWPTTPDKYDDGTPMEQKYKRGNKVKVLFGHPVWGNGKAVTDMCPDEVGKEAIIVGSYADQYGGDNISDYTIMFLETGNRVSWKDEKQLEFIDEGGEHLFEQAKINRDRISEQNKDINFILSKLDIGELSGESIMMLFDLIGYDSAFKRNGEFYVLHAEWSRLHPVFVHIKKSKTLDEAKSIFTDVGLDRYNVEKVFDAFHVVA